MGFFQNSVTNKYLKTLDKKHLQDAYSKFKEHFHNPEIQENIRNIKEEQYQGEFLIHLFVDILGYTKNPTPGFSLTTEYKNVKDAKKADGAIIIKEKVKAVIELKGTDTTDFSKIEIQAFGYKNNQPDCLYVITSNFEKLRFYIENAIEFLEFNLFTLTETEFELLYLCLGYENVERDLPKKIKEESLSREDQITKELYNDYSLFKRELYQNLTFLNPQVDPLTLFKKSQKLLDRFLFLFFSEDRQLLPPNSVRLILDDWRALQDRDVEIPLYSRYKKYFEYLNTGFKGKRYDVFAYNGGLFKTDEILDVLKIDDELLYKHTLKLSDYDFASEVDVNILGHIFENSLNELDEIKAQLDGKEIDKTKSKRKKDGVFYTPKYVTKYIVDSTIGKLCNEKKDELQIIEEVYSSDKKRQKKTTQALAEKLTEYRKWLLQITICDPACGMVVPVQPDTGTQDSWVLKVDSLGCESQGNCWVGQDEIWVRTFTPDKPFVVYPNPAMDKLNVAFHLNHSGARIELFDLYGRVRACTLLPPDNEKAEIVLSTLPPGIYMIRVVAGERVFGLEKLLVK